MSQPWLAEVHLIVDDTRKKIHSVGINNFVNRQLSGWVNIDDSLVFDHDRDSRDRVRQHRMCIFNKLPHPPNLAGTLPLP